MLAPNIYAKFDFVVKGRFPTPIKVNSKKSTTATRKTKKRRGGGISLVKVSKLTSL